MAGEIIVNWNIVVGPACFLLGLLIALYIKDQARIVAKAQIKESIEQMSVQFKLLLSEFKSDLIQDLDSKFRRTSECNLMMQSQDNATIMNTNRIELINFGTVGVL